MLAGLLRSEASPSQIKRTKRYVERGFGLFISQTLDANIMEIREAAFHNPPLRHWHTSLASEHAHSLCIGEIAQQWKAGSGRVGCLTNAVLSGLRGRLDANGERLSVYAGADEYESDDSMPYGNMHRISYPRCCAYNFVFRFGYTSPAGIGKCRAFVFNSFDHLPHALQQYRRSKSLRHMLANSRCCLPTSALTHAGLGAASNVLQGGGLMLPYDLC